MNKTIALLLLTLLTLISPSALAEGDADAALRLYYYPAEECGMYTEFVPDEDAGRELTALLDEVEFQEIVDFPGAWPDGDAPSLEITLEYDGYIYYLRDGGGIRAVQIDGLGLKYAQDASVADYVINLLSDKGYAPFDPESLTGVVRAELSDGARRADEAREPIVLEDSDQLAVLEGLIHGAATSDASGCPFGYAQLTLTTAEGEEITLYPATDSCAQFFAGGMFFNYDSRRGGENHDTNQILFDLFGIEPTEYFHFAE